MGRGTRTLLAFLAGLLVGGAVVHLFDAAEPSGGAGDEVTRVVPERVEGVGRDGTPAASPEEASGTDATLEGLGATAEERAFLRDALAAERLRRREGVIRPEDSGLDVLRRRLEHGADLTALVEDYDAFAAHVRTPAAEAFRVESTGDVTRLTRESVPAGTTVIRFGPGVFEVPALEVFTAFRDREHPVHSFEIRGAGMGTTTLVGLYEWQVAGRVEHLVLRDFTWVAGESTSLMLSVHGSVGTRIENVRMERWRSGGHGAAIGASGPSYLALRGCEFLGGRRGNNSGGNAISLRDDCVVMVEDCLFSDLEYGALAGWKGNGERAGVWVRDCVFENARLAAYGGPDPTWLTVHARGGRAAYGPATWTDEERREQWFHGVAGDVEGVALGPGISRCTTEDLAHALARYAVPADQRVTGIDLTEFDRGGPLAFRLHVVGPERYRTRCIAIRMDEPTPLPTEDDGLHPYLGGLDTADVLPLAALLARVEVPEGITVARFAYSVFPHPDGSGLVPVVQIGPAWDPWIYDARTGGLLYHRTGR